MTAPSTGFAGRARRSFASFAVLGVALLGAADPARAEFRIRSAPISACAGTYTDSGGPTGNYGNSETILQTLWPALPNTRIALSFSAFESESGFDILTLYNGHDTLAPVLGTLDGSIPAQTLASTAADGSLTVKWISDPTTTLAGWAAGISCIPAEERERTDVDFTCDGEFTDSGGPGATYASFENYLLTVHPTHPGDRLEVSFSAFDTESGFDPLSVYDGTSTSDPLLGTFSGTGLPPNLRATNTDGALTFRFNSDGSTVGNGWRARFNCAHRIRGAAVPPVTTCGGTAVDSGGSGGNYSNGELFVQTFLPEDPGAKIALRFDEFLTEAGADQLSIYDGSSTGAPLLGTWSGLSTPDPATSSSVDGALTLSWTSNGSVSLSGWQAELSCVYPIASGVVSTCSAISTDTGGRYGTYGNSESRVQTFAGSRPWSQMRADVPEFSSEDGFDQLKFRDGGAGAPILGTLTGFPPLPASFLAPNLSRQITLDWTSDVSNVFAGWYALIRCELPVFADGFEGRDLAQWSLHVP